MKNLLIAEYEIKYRDFLTYLREQSNIDNDANFSANVYFNIQEKIYVEIRNKLTKEITCNFSDNLFNIDSIIKKLKTLKGFDIKIKYEILRSKKIYYIFAKSSSYGFHSLIINEQKQAPFDVQGQYIPIYDFNQWIKKKTLITVDEYNDYFKKFQELKHKINSF